ncbi:hypothetical protein [Cellulomonas algicola]|nr:hypothetical protein [Cellulomonas algicola]
MTGLLVQAKLLTVRPHHAYAIGQAASRGARTRAGNEDLTQLQVLLDHAAQLGLPAAYALYNDSASASHYAQQCPWQRVLGPLGGIALCGANLAAALVEASAPCVPAHAFETLARPLSCALACQDHVSGRQLAEPLDETVHSALRAQFYAYGGPGVESSQQEFSQGLLRRLFEASRTFDEPEAGEEFLNAVLDDTGLAGVVWVSEGDPSNS